MAPKINESELAQVVEALAAMNPGRASEDSIRDAINANWPFKSLGTAGWIAYLEGGSDPDAVRVAVQPYTACRYLHDLREKLLAATPG